MRDSLLAGVRGEEPHWSPPELPMLAELEMLALGVRRDPSPIIGRLLGLMKRPQTSEGAREQLFASGLWLDELDEGELPLHSAPPLPNNTASSPKSMN